MIEFFAILIGAFCGATHAPFWLVLPLSLMLALPGIVRDRSLAYRFGSVGSEGAVLMFAAASVLNSVVFSAVSYALGYSIVWLSVYALG
jgi:hypothetical protein